MTTSTQKLGARLAELLDSDHWHEVEPQLLTLMKFETACAGLPDGALDGNWTAAGLSAYAKGLEDSLAALRAELAAAKAREAALLTALRGLSFSISNLALEFDRPVTIASSAKWISLNNAQEVAIKIMLENHTSIDAAIGSKG